MSSSSLTYDRFVDFLLAKVPQVRSVYNDHLRDNNELLPHVFMGDVTRFFISEFRKSREGSPDSQDATQVIRTMLTVLEKAIASKDEKLQELVSVSFIENLAQAGSDLDQIKNCLGPGLAAELRAHEQGGVAQGRIH